MARVIPNEVPGTGMNVMQKVCKFRVRIRKSELPEVPGIVTRAFRTYGSSGYGYYCPTELTEVLCRVIPGLSTPGMVLRVPFRHDVNRKIAYGYECRTELTDVPGMYGVGLHRTRSSSGYG